MCVLASPYGIYVFCLQRCEGRTAYYCVSGDDKRSASFQGIFQWSDVVLGLVWMENVTTVSNGTLSVLSLSFLSPSLSLSHMYTGALLFFFTFQDLKYPVDITLWQCRGLWRSWLLMMIRSTRWELLCSRTLDICLNPDVTDIVVDWQDQATSDIKWSEATAILKVVRWVENFIYVSDCNGHVTVVCCIVWFIVSMCLFIFRCYV